MKGKKYFILIGAFSLILSSSLIIAGEWEVPKQLTISLTNDSHPSLFMDSIGNVHLTWFGWDGNDNEIFYTYSINGTFIPVIKVSNNEGNDQLPSLFLDSNGTAYIAWTGNTSGFYEIYYSKEINDTFSQIEKVTNNTEENNFVFFDSPVSFSFFLDFNGIAHIAWQGWDGNDYEIYYVNNSNGNFSSGLNISKVNTSNNGNPSLFLDFNGVAHIAWQGWDGNDYEIYNVNNANSSFSQPELITDNAINDKDPSLCVDSIGTIHMTWSRKDYESWEIYYIHNLNGGFTLPKRCTYNIAWDANSLIKADFKGNIHIIWQSDLDGDEDIYYINNLDSDTGNFSQLERVTNNDANDRFPCLFLDSDGTAHIAWSSNENGNYDIYYSKYILIQNENERWWFYTFILAIMIIGEIIFFLILKAWKNKQDT